MANESTWGSISALVGNIYDIAVQGARDMNIMAPLVTTWGNLSDSRSRLLATLSGGTFATTTEATDLAGQIYNPTVAGTAIPAVYAQAIVLTQRRINSDPMGAQMESGQYLAQTAAQFVDTQFSGTAIFSNLTGGTVGTAGGTLTWQNIMRASAYLRAAKAPMPYYCVLRPEQWYYINYGTSGVPSLLQNNQLFANSALSQFYQGSYAGINFFTDANITTGTAAVGAMFAPQAIYLDMRTPFTINPQWDASRSGSGAWELNAFMECAFGVFRPTFGCQVIGTSS